MWVEIIVLKCILKNVITLVCNRFLITQLLLFWAICCSKSVLVDLYCAPLFLPAQVHHSWHTSMKRGILGLSLYTLELHPSHLQLVTLLSYIRSFIPRLRGAADVLMECDSFGSGTHPVTNRTHPCQDHFHCAWETIGSRSSNRMGCRISQFHNAVVDFVPSYRNAIMAVKIILSCTPTFTK